MIGKAYFSCSLISDLVQGTACIPRGANRSWPLRFQVSAVVCSLDVAVRHP